jgi:AAA15 family ATPase/GTPase
MHIKKLEITNFKSIKGLSLECSRINIFTGDPNTGKTNILEALGLFTLFNNECRISELARFESLYNLFYDNNIDNQVEINTDMHRLKIIMKENFEVYVETKLKTAIKNYDLYYDASGKLLNPNPHYISPVRYYQCRPSNYFYNKSTDFLRPPYGDNLVLMLLKNKALRQDIANLYKSSGFKLVINPQESSVQLQKEEEGVIISYPYSLVSETYQRFAFYLAAMRTNKDSILVFDGPESYTASEYTLRLADAIAGDETNQYFISTHSPAFLNTLMEKALEKVTVFNVSYENYQTKVKQENREGSIHDGQHAENGILEPAPDAAGSV